MPRRAHVLAIAFFPAFQPPTSGGEMRLGSLYRQLSRHCDVTLLTSTHFEARIERIAHAQGFVELRFPKDDHWRRAYAALARAGLEGDLAGLAFALAVADPDCPLRCEARRLAGEVDAVIHDFPYSEPIFDDGCPVPEIYNAHNVEASLFASIVAGAGAERGFLKLLRLEGNLCARARRVFAVSATDREIFRLLYGVDPARLALCPNGIDAREYDPVDDLRWAEPEALDRRPKLLFLGSAHPPNVEAARYLRTLARDLPECDVVIAGGVCAALDAAPANVTLAGPFDAAGKLALLAEADLFVNPVAQGSGTSLKALEAMAAALPMVATPEGVRGLDLVAGTHAAISGRETMAATIRALLADAPARQAMAASARDFVRTRYDWRAIAESFAASLALPPPPAAPAQRPLALAFNDYAIRGSASGGAARIRGLLGHLDADVALVGFAEAHAVTLPAPGFLAVTVAKSPSQRALETAISAGRARSADDAVAAIFAASHRALAEVAARLAQRARVAVFEHPYMAPALDAILTLRPDLPVVYSAHNVEAELKRAMWRGDPLGAAIVGLTEALERELVARAAFVVACTEADAAHFRKAGAEVVIAPNGCDLPAPGAARPAPGRTRARAGFLGSGHPPNVEAARYILSVLAPRFPEVRFEFVGSVCDALAAPPANATLHGQVGEAEKSRLLSAWDIGLAPLASGGGSSLKLADYLAHGLPALATPEGARGFPLVARRMGQVAERARFAAALAAMLRHRGALQAMGAEARRYAAEQLAWSRTTADYRQRLAALAAPPRTPARSLLVVTYRYTEPALGGAEAYLLAVLERLRPRFDRIDLAAVDVEQIGNRFHYGCRVTRGPGAAGRIGDLFDAMRFFPAEEPDDAALLALARGLARDWAREDLALMAPLAAALAGGKGLHLLAGFFPAETIAGIRRRWTAPAFVLLAPASARVLQLKGHAPRPTTLRLTAAKGADAPGEARRFEADIAGPFDLHWALPDVDRSATLWLRGEVEAFTAPDDVRPLGLLLETIAALCETETPADAAGTGPLAPISAPLDPPLDEVWRTARLESWVDALVGVARGRGPETDAAFAAARGPHAPALQSWLAVQAPRYDVVLVQGVPFDVLPRTVDTLARLDPRPRIVALPHFHAEDRFYHWRDYYRAFEQADRTLLFSEVLADRVAPRERARIVPGGGVRLDEAADPLGAEAFRAVRPSRNAYFLVLGRKAGSKNYQRVIDAHQILRASRRDVDLVLIGPDEDQRPVRGAGVAYLGAQPREVVRGALAGCLALVNMSGSESFGIVLCEAWLFGKPVIANADCHAFRTLARDGEDALLVDSDAALAAAMARLAADPAERERMGRAGFARTAERFSWAEVADAIAAALEA